MAAEIDFYTNPKSRGQIARWALEEVGAPYAEHIVAYGPAMYAEAFLKINPMGKVPAIVHRGRVVTETPAICAYLARAFPDAGLSPTLDEEADFNRWLFFGAGPFEQAVTAKYLGWTLTPEQEGMAGFGNMNRVLQVLEAKFTQTPFVCGDRFTMADVYMGAQIAWGLMFQSIPSSPAFVAYAARVTERAAYVRAKARDAALSTQG